MLHSELSSAPHTWHQNYEVVEKQQQLIRFCKEWRLPAPIYRYTRTRGSRYEFGLHSSVIVNDIEYSSTLSSNDMHPGWNTKNDAREAVAGEVLRVLGLDSDDFASLPLIPEE